MIDLRKTASVFAMAVLPATSACGDTSEDDGAASGGATASGGLVGGGVGDGDAPGSGAMASDLVVSLFTGRSVTGSCYYGYREWCEELVGSIHDDLAVRMARDRCMYEPDEDNPNDNWPGPPDTPILDIVWRADEPCPKEGAISSCYPEGYSLKVYYEGASSVSSMACGATFETYDGDE